MKIYAPWRLRGWQALAALCALFLAGCSDPMTDATAAKLNRIGNLFGPFCVTHGLQGPASAAEFKDYIRTCPQLQLQTLQVNKDNLDPLFQSDRDQQPFVFRYGLSLVGPGGKASRQLVAYEQTGKSGKRLALFTTGKVELVDESTLKQMVQ